MSTLQVPTGNRPSSADLAAAPATKITKSLSGSKLNLISTDARRNLLEELNASSHTVPRHYQHLWADLHLLSVRATSIFEACLETRTEKSPTNVRTFKIMLEHTDGYLSTASKNAAEDIIKAFISRNRLAGTMEPRLVTNSAKGPHIEFGREIKIHPTESTATTAAANINNTARIFSQFCEDHAILIAHTSKRVQHCASPASSGYQSATSDIE